MATLQGCHADQFLFNIKKSIFEEGKKMLKFYSQLQLRNLEILNFCVFFLQIGNPYIAYTRERGNTYEIPR